jgi:hypothetical protein
MVLGVDPQKMAQIQAVCQNIKAVIKVDQKLNQVVLTLSTDDQAASAMIPTLLTSFSDGLAVQLSSYFAIKGEIIEVGSDS